MSDFTGDLPEEVLAGCFDGLRLKDVMSASHVSRYWRSSALSFPHLWTQVTIGGASESSADLVHLAMSRAGQLPIDFEYVQLSDAIPRSVSDAASQYMHRFRKFKWISAISSVDITRPAPLLREFHCGDDRFTIPKDFLGGASGNLRSLILGEARFARECPALASVLHFRASFPWAAGTYAHSWRLFDLCPTLETLHLRHLSGAPGCELPAGPAPRTLKLVKLKADAGCDLVNVYEAWQLASIERVRLTMPLTASLDISPVVKVAKTVFVMFEGRKRAHIFTYLSNSRRHVLAFYDLGYQPSLSLAQLLGDAAGLTQIQTLHIPLCVLGPLVSKTFVLPQLANLVVYVAENDEFETRPYLEDEQRQPFRWTSLSCLSEITRCFPNVAAPVLAVQREDSSLSPTLDDAQRLVEYLSAPGNCTLREVHVAGFAEDVTRSIPPPLKYDSPQVMFTSVHQTFIAHPNAYRQSD